MNILVKNHESRIGSLLSLLLLVGVGVGLIHFAGGIMSGIFSSLFFLFALLPLDSVIHPETNILELYDGILGWCNIKQGKKVVEGSVPVQDIRRIVRSKTAAVEGHAVVDIQLETYSGQNIELPKYLHLSVHEKKILSALVAANPSIRVGKRDKQNKSAHGTR